MATEESSSSSGAPAACDSSSVIPEVEMFAYLIVLVFLCDQKRFEQVRWWWSRSLPRSGIQGAPIGRLDQVVR